MILVILCRVQECANESFGRIIMWSLGLVIKFQYIFVIFLIVRYKLSCFLVWAVIYGNIVNKFRLSRLYWNWNSIHLSVNFLLWSWMTLLQGATAAIKWMVEFSLLIMVIFSKFRDMNRRRLPKNCRHCTEIQNNLTSAY